MQKREAQDPDSTTPASGAVATPLVSGEQPVATPSVQVEFGLEPGLPSQPSDTLLSAGKPADRFELLVEDRLVGIEERLRELEGRLAILEHKKTSVRPEPRRQQPWLWIAFLIALVVVFQLLHRMR
jgi:hypothetical protein